MHLHTNHNDEPPLDVRALAGEESQRRAFALFRQAMLGIGDLGRTDPDAERRFLAGGSPLGGYEEDTLRGAVNGFESWVFLPGGSRVRHLSVTHVGVSPTATRRGIARRLLVEQLRRAHAEGYVVAGLRASDARIYGRYGYGVASWSAAHELDLTQTGLAFPVSRDGIRTVDPRENFPLFRRIADADPSPRAAVLSRWDGWWTMQEYRTLHGTTPHHAAVFGEEGKERGFMRFHVEPTDNWFTSPRRTVIIDDFVAHDAEAWRGLIAHLFAQDILHHAVFPSRPVDDPLQLLLNNPRAVKISGQRDESWIRVLDIERLLAARRYGGDLQIVVSVEDALFEHNKGNWSIGPEGVRRSHDRPQARVEVQDLVSLLFGARSASSLTDSGRIDLASTSTVEKLDTLFCTGRLPHSGISF